MPNIWQVQLPVKGSRASYPIFLDWWRSNIDTYMSFLKENVRNMYTERSSKKEYIDFLKIRYL